MPRTCVSCEYRVYVRERRAFNYLYLLRMICKSRARASSDAATKHMLKKYVRTDASFVFFDSFCVCFILRLRVIDCTPNEKKIHSKATTIKTERFTSNRLYIMHTYYGFTACFKHSASGKNSIISKCKNLPTLYTQSHIHHHRSSPLFFPPLQIET